MRHKLKIWPGPLGAIEKGEKKFEFRRDDREPRFDVGDELQLACWNPSYEGWTGRSIIVHVKYICRGPDFGIPDGYCVMSIDLKRNT